jgi:hypothetical protein
VAACGMGTAARANAAHRRALGATKTIPRGSLCRNSSISATPCARLTAEVALARVGLVVGLEVSRLARNNADWHRLIDLRRAH